MIGLFRYIFRHKTDTQWTAPTIEGSFSNARGDTIISYDFLTVNSFSTAFDWYMKVPASYSDGFALKRDEFCASRTIPFTSDKVGIDLPKYGLGFFSLNQMTEIEAYIGRKKIPPQKKSELSPMLCFLFIKGVAQNTNVSVYLPEGGNDDECWTSLAAKRGSFKLWDLCKQTCPFLDSLASLVVSSPYLVVEDAGTVVVVSTKLTKPNYQH